MKLILAMLLIASAADARTVNFSPGKDISVLKKNLLSAGFKNPEVVCFPKQCTLYLNDNERKDPSSFIREAPAEKQSDNSQRRLEAMAILKRLREDPQSVAPADKDKLLVDLGTLVLGE